MADENLIFISKDKCIGCTNCIRRCPSEAIRVKEGKAVINMDSCIFCGECIKNCHHHAIHPILDEMDIMYNYEKRIVIPDPALFAQFRNISSTSQIVKALKIIGFTDVLNISRASKIISLEEKKLIEEKNNKPLISSSCPAVSKLIQTRFPALIDNLIKLESVLELTVKLALGEYDSNDKNRVGIFYITPCTAKAAVIKKSFYKQEFNINGVFSISKVYPKLIAALSEVSFIDDSEKVDNSGIEWAAAGGETKYIGYEKSLWVDGIYNIINILEQVELEKLDDIGFIEARACTEGCIGGELTVENAYIAKSRINKIVSESAIYDRGIHGEDYNGQIAWNTKLEFKPVMKLDIDFNLALKKMKKIEQICNKLPGLDCGACGAPSCRVLAEDIVRGVANKGDCPVSTKLKRRQII